MDSANVSRKCWPSVDWIELRSRVAKLNSQQVVTNWLKRSQVGLDSERDVRAATGVSLDWLNRNEGVPFPSGPIRHDSSGPVTHQIAERRSGADFAFQLREGPPRGDYVRFPLLEGFAGAGVGAYGDDYSEVVEFVEVTHLWSQANLRAPSESVRVIAADGDSMRGDVEDGDLLFIDSRVKAYDSDGLYVFRRQGRVHVKRLQLMNDGRTEKLEPGLRCDRRDCGGNRDRRPRAGYVVIEAILRR